jgi:CubicO group peptidase (beta-lactamase class C family)
MVSRALTKLFPLSFETDKTGKEMYAKVSGYNSVAADAEALRDDCFLKVASSAKLITTIALLQCIDKGLIGIDDSINKILPELSGKEIVTKEVKGKLIFEPSKTSITARQLLSHTSGIGYRFTHPLLTRWAKSEEGRKHQNSYIVTERYDQPLVFEPGTGWLYGAGLDWAGAAVSRLNGGISLEKYMVENIWKRVGLTAPFPTSHISKDPIYEERLMQAGKRLSADGPLRAYKFTYGDNPVDQEGGAGLICTANDFIAVLVDLISDSPKLLKPETISLMFTPQIEAGSVAMSMLLKHRHAWEAVAGPVSDVAVNHGLGGWLVTGDAPEINQPHNLLGGGGALNNTWFASRELGVVGFFATQIFPFGDPVVTELINAWKKDFWSKFDAGA